MMNRLARDPRKSGYTFVVESLELSFYFSRVRPEKSVPEAFINTMRWFSSMRSGKSCKGSPVKEMGAEIDQRAEIASVQTSAQPTDIDSGSIKPVPPATPSRVKVVKPRQRRRIIGPPRGVKVNPRVVFVTQPGTVVDFCHSHLTLRTKEDIVKLPGLLTRELVIGQGVELHPRAARFLLAADIPVTFLDAQGQPLGHLRGTIRHDVSPRLAQFRLYDNKELRLQLVQSLVRAKALNCCAVLQRHRKNHPEFDCRVAVKAIRRYAAATGQAGSIESLRGLEGAAARVYFKIFSGMIPPDFVFEGRTRRPPLNPVNSLLSYTYTFFSRAFSSVAEALSLDPYLGFLHEPVPGRPALALDLIEPLRPALADRFVVTALNRGEIQLEDFFPPQQQDGAVYLTGEGKNKFFRAIEHWLCNCQQDLKRDDLTSPRALVEREVESFKKALLAGAISTWAPYRFLGPGEKRCIATNEKGRVQPNDF